MNRAARLSILAAYAAAAAWALAPAPPKPLAATIAPPPPPPRYERQYRPEPPPIPRERIEPDEYRGSLNEAPQQTALHPPETYTGAGYYPHGLKTEMDEADHFAIATLRIKQLPPVEFDHALAGPVEVIDIESEERLRQLCHMTQTHQGVNVIGCAGRKPDRCVIYLGPIPASSGITRNINLRHELGHCNGWPADHAGIR